MSEYQLTGLQDRICKLLGQGIEAGRVASALGCEQSYISQLLADDQFKERVQSLKLDLLQAATERDERINSLEDKLIKKVDDALANPLQFRTGMEQVRALSMVNNLKRRGANNDGAITQQNNTIVQLVLPTHIVNKFANKDYQLDINNQVIQAGEQSLVTMQSGSLELMIGAPNNELSKFE